MHLGKLRTGMSCRSAGCKMDSSCLSAVPGSKGQATSDKHTTDAYTPPTPAAGRTVTSTRASKAFSSRLGASMGPLTAAVTVKPQCENVADPSALGKRDSSAAGTGEGAIPEPSRSLQILRRRGWEMARVEPKTGQALLRVPSILYLLRTKYSEA